MAHKMGKVRGAQGMQSPQNAALFSHCKVQGCQRPLMPNWYFCTSFPLSPMQLAPAHSASLCFFEAAAPCCPHNHVPACRCYPVPLQAHKPCPWSGSGSSSLPVLVQGPCTFARASLPLCPCPPLHCSRPTPLPPEVPPLRPSTPLHHCALPVLICAFNHAAQHAPPHACAASARSGTPRTGPHM